MFDAAAGGIRVTRQVQAAVTSLLRSKTSSAKRLLVDSEWLALLVRCVVECRICNQDVAGSNLGRGYFAPRSTQPYIPPGSVNEYQLRLGRQRQVWLIPIADERVGVQVKL